ncbi:MAG: hypothetical protein PHQ23_16270 [Candidatus Wallbacteria bacterium]|nr:hypothetical protein [Candidatus Wallbacteria bacterium]
MKSEKGHDVMRIWKVSLGENDFNMESREYFLKEQLLVVHGETRKGGGANFTEKMQVGDFVYLCFGNDAGIRAFGIVDSDHKASSFGKGWRQRKFRIIKQSLKIDKYKGLKKGWAPNYNSTCTCVHQEDLKNFEKEILIPYFGLNLDDLFKFVKSDFSQEGNMRMNDLNLIFFGPLEIPDDSSHPFRKIPATCSGIPATL